MGDIIKLDFSVITPVYNGEKYLESTIVSVLTNLKDYNFEYIVVNDGSTDSSQEIINKFNNKIKCIKKVNQGQARAINSGLEVAQGMYSIIVNSDDPINSKELFKLSKEILDSQEKTVVAYPDWEIIDSAGRIIKSITVPEYSKNELVGNSHCLVGPGGVFRTEIAKKIGGWDPNFKFVPDYDFWLRMSTQGNFCRVPGYLALWRDHEDSLSISGRSLPMAKERIEVIQKFLNKYPQNKHLTRMARSNSYYRAAILSFYDYKVPGLNYLLKAFIHHPRSIIHKHKLILAFLVSAPVSSRIIKIRFIRKIASYYALKINSFN